MQAYDLIMLIVLGMSMIFGAIKGFAWQIASLASIIVSYLVSYRFRFQVADMIHAAPPWNQFLAMLILYVGTSFVIWVGFRLLSSAIDQVRLKEFDRHMGAAFGLAKGAIYCLLITMFAMSLLGPNQQSAICQSRSGFYITKMLDNGVGVLPKEIHDVVGPYLVRLDEKLKEGRSGLPLESNGESLWTNGLPSLPGIGSQQTAAGQGAGNGWDVGGLINSVVPNQLPGLQGSQSTAPGAGNGFQQNFPPYAAPANPILPPDFSLPNTSGFNGFETQSAQQPSYLLPR